MTPYRIKKCQTVKETWYEVQYKIWRWWPFWTTLCYADGYPPLKYPTEEEARYVISSAKKRKKEKVVKVSYIKDI